MNSRYPWTPAVVNGDIVVTGRHATWFGGANDPQDDGETASGVSTKANPSFLGCALPMDLGPGAKHNPCAGAPLPKLPWFTSVVVTNLATGRTLTVKLIDLGPSGRPVAEAAIDLTQAAFVALGGDLEEGKITVDFRIPHLGFLLTGSLRDKPTPADGGDFSVTPTFGAVTTIGGAA